MSIRRSLNRAGQSKARASRRRFLKTAGLWAVAAGSSEFLLRATGALAAPPAPRKRLAAIVTTYYRYSHADDIVTRFIEGYIVDGRHHQTAGQVVSLYTDQVTYDDLGGELARRHRIRISKTIADALTLGGKGLGVDGVLIVAEQGDYPFNEKGQQLYPRREFFEQTVDIFRKSGRAVPVYVDKHLSYSWPSARWMYDQSRELGFAMMAGSSVPLAPRRPPLELPVGGEIAEALAVGYGSAEAYGFHALEALQAMVERRPGGEHGVRAVQCLEGRAAWDAARSGRWSRPLLDAALARMPHADGRRDVEQVDHDAIVYLVEYSDGLKAAVYMSTRHVSEFGFAARLGLARAGGEQSGPLVSTWMELPKPDRDHFSYLTRAIDRMFAAGVATYPVERTLLTTGMLAALMDSKFDKHRRIETPHLAEIRYQPAPTVAGAERSE